MTDDLHDCWGDLGLVVCEACGLPYNYACTSCQRNLKFTIAVLLGQAIEKHPTLHKTFPQFPELLAARIDKGPREGEDPSEFAVRCLDEATQDELGKCTFCGRSLTILTGAPHPEGLRCSLATPP